jgi:hypothetical protein
MIPGVMAPPCGTRRPDGPQQRADQRRHRPANYRSDLRPAALRPAALRPAAPRPVALHPTALRPTRVPAEDASGVGRPARGSDPLPDARPCEEPGDVPGARAPAALAPGACSGPVPVSRSSGTIPPAASAARARRSVSSSSMPSGGAPSTTLTTHSLHAFPRTVQLSQSMITYPSSKTSPHFGSERVGADARDGLRQFSRAGSEPRDESADEPRDESADGGRLGDNGSGQPSGATAPGRAVNASAPVEASQERRRRDDPCT